MKKLKFNLDEIKVESFKVDKVNANEGTVLAQASGALSGCISCGGFTACYDPSCVGVYTCGYDHTCTLVCDTVGPACEV